MDAVIKEEKRREVKGVSLKEAGHAEGEEEGTGSSRATGIEIEEEEGEGSSTTGSTRGAME